MIKVKRTSRNLAKASPFGMLYPLQLNWWEFQCSNVQIHVLFGLYSTRSSTRVPYVMKIFFLGREYFRNSNVWRNKCRMIVV